MSKYYCIYIITNTTDTVLYTGVTGNLIGRIYHHRNKSASSFSSKYNLNKLVYYEIFEDVTLAIKREKQIKASNRKKKIELITKFNNDWKDLYSSLF
ncbi:MAG: GIY-YIG nuclease family protein [bacterium]|nr:GIY-YIG nuclease family protein [bacterium]